MFRVFFILFFISVQFVVGQDKELPWREEFKLTWGNFEAKPDVNHPYAAITYSGMSYQFSANVVNGKVDVDYKVSSFFVANKSWVKSNLADDELLAHEQLHFDITELFARKFRKELSKMVFTEDVKNQIRKVYRKITEAKAVVQETYDKETNHSKNVEKQKVWEKKIAKELQILKAFASK